jgi:nitrite reductase/ring-hydroxylating ferredoxin subunit
MVEPTSTEHGLELCDSAMLGERSRAHVWDVMWRDEPATAFALRIDGAVVAYLNRCVHVAAEMDWNPGEFLDQERRLVVCSLHGASYAPETGRCVGGPCGRGALVPVPVREVDAHVRWYPTADVRPRS